MKNNLKNISFLFIALIIINFLPLTSLAAATNSKGLETFVLKEDESFDKIFRQGRELIDQEQWPEAAGKFNEIVCDCPDKKNVDAAFYWLAFCYKKQKLFAEMDKTLDRLLENFPDSSWADDARVMKFDRPAASKTMLYTTAAGKNQSQESYDALASKYDQIATTLYSTSSETKLDRDDEIKLAAFQSLLSANPSRAIEVLGKMLRTDSNASESLKRELLKTTRSPKFSGANASKAFSTYGGFNSKVYHQLQPQLRETLVNSYQNESNVVIKKEIIYALANINDDQSANFIVQLYSGEIDKELKKSIIMSFGGSQYFSFGTNSAFATTNSPYFDKFIEIGRTEKDIELRRLVFSNLRRFAGWSANEGMIETVAKLYDSEIDEECKISIIQSLAEAKEKKATAKLLDIAKNDKSDKMRLAAIRSLRNRTEPEVLKFLEDLIK